MYILKIVQRVLMPASSAASGLPPYAYTATAESPSRGEPAHDERDADEDYDRIRKTGRDQEASGGSVMPFACGVLAARPFGQ